MSKRKHQDIWAAVFAGVFVVPVFTAPAHAYIDPGTASIILQSVIGGIAAAGLFFRTHVMSVYYKLFPGQQQQSSARPSTGGSPEDAS